MFSLSWQQQKATKMLDDFMTQVADASGEKADDLKSQGMLTVREAVCFTQKKHTSQLTYN